MQPLLEVMQPDSLVGLFAAVLLEQRVLLRVSGCHGSRCVDSHSIDVHPYRTTRALTCSRLMQCHAHT